MSKKKFSHDDLVKVAHIVQEECDKVLPDLFKIIKKRLDEETNVKKTKIRKVNMKRARLGKYAQFDGIEWLDKDTTAEHYVIPFLTLECNRP